MRALIRKWSMEILLGVLAVLVTTLILGGVQTWASVGILEQRAVAIEMHLKSMTPKVDNAVSGLNRVGAALEVLTQGYLTRQADIIRRVERLEDRDARSN